MSAIARNDREIFLRAFSFVIDPTRLLQNGFTREPPYEQENPLPAERACSMGWLADSGADYYGGPGSMRAIFDAEAQRRGDPDGITSFSDNRTHAEVVELWRAIGIAHGWLTPELARAA